MFRDKRTHKEISDFVARQRELAEAQEDASSHPLTPEHRRILEVLNLAGDYCYQKSVAERVGIDVPRTVWLLESLQVGGYVRWANQDRYRIEQKGRDFLYGTSV